MVMRLKKMVVAAASIVLIGACGGDKASPLETIQNAAAETADAKTASIAMTINGGAGSLKNLEMNGAYDFGRSLMSFEMDASKLGIQGATGTIEAVMDFSKSVIQYMKFPGLEEETGKAWMKIDVGDAVASICPDIDFAAMLQSQSGDPTSGLRLLEGAKSVEELGTESVRGTDTTHYRVKVDVRDAANKAPESARETMKEVASWYVDPIQTTEVWIDDEGRARRYEATTDTANLKMPECLANAQGQNPFQGKTEVSYELFDFGKKVDIAVPASDDVVDLADLSE